ncbi:hypothetical protein HPB50_019333 [Hyalomma asiaticum]|uniref:Uncharacterized protein n=1 Tax=Hyalomma asiaticum TaxID=266040 RepID=A0ACB7SY25_HYAAI|nr:hypothetical protein HPB50_019333 [Hyalomma asiaticum]
MAVLEEIKSGQAPLLNEVKSIRTKLSQNDKAFGDIRRHLANIEDDVSSVTVPKNKISDVATIVDKNTKAIDDLSSRLNDSEDRARRLNLVSYVIAL